jgi:predicted ATPase
MSIITRLCIAGYRSLRDVRLEIGPLTVVTGANGSGKSSLYRALRWQAARAGNGAQELRQPEARFFLRRLRLRH